MYGAPQHWMSSIRAYQLSLATRAEESAMPGQSKRRSARRRVPQQIDLFAQNTPTIGGLPAWPGLPRETQEALTALMIRLILDHADQRRISSTGDGHDL
jgi:hypothetical protein